MKRKISLYLLPVFILGFFAFTHYTSGTREKVLLEVLSKSITLSHYQNAILDKNFSQKFYNLYIKNIDVRKLFLLKDDLDKLGKFKGKLDVEIKDASYDFFDLSVKILGSRVNESELIYKEILGKPFNFDQAETIETDPDKLEFSKNEKERRERWRKLLKYQTLIKLDELLTRQENAINQKDTAYKVLEFGELEKQAREKVLNDYTEYFHRLKKEDYNDKLSIYLNSYISSFDPHSEYMPPKDKANFDINMSGQLEGIGAQLVEQDGYIKVSSIVPGSPSYKQGELKAGDLILKVAQGEAEPVSIVDMKIDDAVQLIRGKKGTEVRLTVKKASGAIVTISIIRDIVILEDRYAKSAIVQLDGSSKRYGYIYLPSFYVDFNNRNGRRCATDIELEIEKLKREDIQGIILDLRFNGGGSLPDVVEMGGLFIKDGPIVQVKSRDEKPYILSDRDSRIQYDGDLLIMVNLLSASASEILAAAMQDYGRAVIVGAPATFGKGTVQRMIELDDVISNSYSEFKPFGALKVTTQKFYRINGGATQLKGVIPDIILPDIYEDIDIGEKELDNVMQWDEISPVNYTKWQLPVSNLAQLNELSKARVHESSTFNLITENAKRLKNQSDISEYSLNLKEYRAFQTKLKEESKKFDNLLKDDTHLTARSLAADMEVDPNDTMKVSLAKSWHKELKKDVYIEEAIKIIQDMK
jgi:carboxyl-terminal processing protease